MNQGKNTQSKKWNGRLSEWFISSVNSYPPLHPFLQSIQWPISNGRLVLSSHLLHYSSVSHFASFSFLIHSLISYTGQSGPFLFQSPFFKHFSSLSSRCFSSYTERDYERDEEQLIWRKQRTISSSSPASACTNIFTTASPGSGMTYLTLTRSVSLPSSLSLCSRRWNVHRFHEALAVHTVLKHHLMCSKHTFNTHTHTLLQNSVWVNFRDSEIISKSEMFVGLCEYEFICCASMLFKVSWYWLNTAVTGSLNSCHIKGPRMMNEKITLTLAWGERKGVYTCVLPLPEKS